MKAVMDSSKSQDSSSSKRHFHWTKKIGSEDEHNDEHDHHDHDNQPSIPSLLKSSSSSRPSSEEDNNKKEQIDHQTCARRKLQKVAVARLRSVVLSALGRNRSSLANGLGTKVVGTLFGSRRGHVHFAFQKEPSSQPAFLIELATPIGGLVKEMASGIVRIALECDKEKRVVGGHGHDRDQVKKRLLEENCWRTFCNGKKSGFANRRDCGPRDWKILRAVEPISMGAGVLPPDDGNHDHHDDHDEVMYMRAKFERIVGSRDSEAFYMMNPDSNGAPELSIYLLRV